MVRGKWHCKYDYRRSVLRRLQRCCAVRLCIGGNSRLPLAKAKGTNYWWGTEPANCGNNRNQWSIAWWNKPNIYTFQADDPNIVSINNFNCDITSFSSTHGNTNEYWQSKLDARGQYEPYTKAYSREGLDYQIGGNMDDISNYYGQGYDKLHLRVSDYGPNGDFHRMAVRKIKYVPGKKLIFKVYDPGAGIIEYSGLYCTTYSGLNCTMDSGAKCTIFQMSFLV